MKTKRKRKKSLQFTSNRGSVKKVQTSNKGDCMPEFTQESLDELIAQAKSMNDLTTALVEATKALAPGTNPTTNTFTQEELNAVLEEVEKLRTALTAMVVPAVPPIE